MSTSRLAVTAAAAIAAVALVAAGCGGSSDENSATVDWANGVCSAVTTWKGRVVSATDTLKGSGDNRVESAVTEVQDATRTLADELSGLGSPGTDAGTEVKASLDSLGDQLNESVEAIDEAASGAEGEGLTARLAAVTAISGTLTSMSQAVSRTVEGIKQADAGDELTNAFDDADSCADLE